LHSTGTALFGAALLVLNTYSDSISVVDTATNKVMRTIKPGPANCGAGPRPAGLRRRAQLDRRGRQQWRCLRRALQSNVIAVVNLSGGATQSVMGLMSVAPLASPRSLFQAQIYTPSFTIPI
jgi:YVTN family beta-propeller protein